MGLSRRNQMLAQYRYAEACGEFITIQNPFACGYEVPGLTLYGKTVLSGTPSPDSPAAITDAFTASSGAAPQLTVRDGNNALCHAIGLSSIGPLGAIPGSDVYATWADGVKTVPYKDLILTGAENWYTDATYWQPYGIYRLAIDCPAAFHKSISTHFVSAQYMMSATQMEVGQMMVAASRIYIRTDITQGAAALKSWLAAQYAAETPVVIRYFANAPTVTNAALPDGLKFVSGVNSVGTVSTSLPSQIKLKYLAHA